MGEVQAQHIQEQAHQKLAHQQAQNNPDRRGQRS